MHTFFQSNGSSLYGSNRKKNISLGHKSVFKTLMAHVEICEVDNNWRINAIWPTFWWKCTTEVLLMKRKYIYVCLTFVLLPHLNTQHNVCISLRLWYIRYPSLLYISNIRCSTIFFSVYYFLYERHLNFEFDSFWLWTVVFATWNTLFIESGCTADSSFCLTNVKVDLNLPHKIVYVFEFFRNRKTMKFVA